MKKHDLEERLINFAAACIDIVESLPNTLAGNYYAGQLARSSGSPALHYGEAQAAESTRDFIHKMKVCLKELRESYNCLRIIKKKEWLKNEMVVWVDENNQLVSTFVASVNTARKNDLKIKNKE